ncbi:MAG: Dethiobiotin synthetase [Cyanobacteria bacterium J06632_3]
MDFQSARQELITQTLPQHETKDTFLGRLRRGYPPVPGQVTSLLLILRVLQDGLQQAPELNRELAHALFLVAYESRNLFESGRAAGVAWPPLLDDDLERIAIAAYKIFTDAPVETPQ